MNITLGKQNEKFERILFNNLKVISISPRGNFLSGVKFQDRFYARLELVEVSTFPAVHPAGDE